MMAEISVLMSTFNRANLMKLPIESVLNQTYKDFTLIICDDGSTDGTWKVLNTYAKKDSRIILLRNEVNKGVPFTKNRLLDACETKYACWQDSDDLSNIHRLEIELDYIKKYSGMVGCRVYIVRSDLSKVNYHEKPLYIDEGGITNASLFFPVDKKIRFPEDKNWFGTDSVWVHRMQKKYPVTYINRVLYYIKFHQNRIGRMKRVYRLLSPKIRKGMSFADVVNYVHKKKKGQ